MRSSSECSMKLGILKHTNSSPPGKSTTTWVPPNTGDHLSSTWISLMRSELLIKVLINMGSFSTQLLRLEAGEVEEGTFLQKE